MRVTNTMIANTATRNVLNTGYKYMQIQEQMGSGKKVNRPSDDPVSMAKILSCRQGLSQAAQYMRNIDHAEHLLRQSDNALNALGTQLTKARTLAEQMSTGTYTEEQHKIVAKEINAIRSQLVQIANTQVNNKYIFAGTGTVKPAFVSATGTPPDNMVYDVPPSIPGNATIVDINAVIGPNMLLPTNIPGTNIFQPQPPGPQVQGLGTTDIFRVLQDLEEALTGTLAASAYSTWPPNTWAPPVAADPGSPYAYYDTGTSTWEWQAAPPTNDDVIANNLKLLRNITENVESQRAVLGARINVLESTKYYWKDFELTMKDHLAAIEEITLEDVLTELSMRELAYTASLTAASRAIMPSLVQYLS